MQHNFHQMFPLLLSLQKCSLHVTFVLMMYMCNKDKKQNKLTFKALKPLSKVIDNQKRKKVTSDETGEIPIRVT